MEEIIIAQENRVILGKLIRIYQKEHNMTLCQLIDGVCSKQVATNMGKGLSAKNDDHYLEMLSKFGLSYNYSHSMDSKILLLSKKLKDAIEWYDFKKVKNICNEGMELLRPYKQYVLEHEVYLVLSMVRKYYCVSQEIEKESEHFLRVMWMLNHDLCDVGKCVVFKYYYRYHGFGDKNNLVTQHVRELIHLSESNNPILMLQEVLCLIISLQCFDAFKILNTLEEYFIKRENYNGLLDTYGKVVYLIKIVQVQSLDVYSAKVDKLIEEHRNELEEERVALISMNLGKSYLDEMNYSRAKSYFNYTIKQPKYFYESSVCLNYILNKLNEEVTKDLFIFHEDISSEKIVHNLYTYYYLKFNQANQYELKLFLKQNILKKIPKEHFYYKIVLDELESLKGGNN